MPCVFQLKQEGERIVADVGLCDDPQKSLRGSGQRKQIFKVQKSDQPLVGTKRKILPRPQIQIQNLNFSANSLPVTQVQVVAQHQAQKAEPKKQHSLTVKNMSPLKSQSSNSRGRKILPRPLFPKNIGQLQPNKTNIQHSISLNKPQPIASGNTCNVLAVNPTTVNVSRTLPIQSAAHVPTQVKSQAPVPEFTSTCTSNMQTVLPVKPTKNGCMHLKKALAPGRKLLPRPQQTTCNQGAYIPSQQIQSVAALQQVQSINPVSTSQNVPNQQFQNINSANIHQSPTSLQSLQGIPPVSVQQALPVQQLQNIPTVSSQQALPLQQLPNVTFENSTQSVPIQQLQSIPAVSMHQSLPLQSLQEVVTTNSLQPLQALPSASAHHAVPFQHLPNISSNLMPSLPKLAPANMQTSISVNPVPTAAVQQQLSVQSLQAISPGSVGQDMPVQQVHSVHPSTRSAVPHQELRNITTITTQAVPVQGQCILSASKQHKIPIQTVHPVSTINTCSSLPVQLQSSQQQLPLQQIQLNPNAVPQQSVPIQQLSSNVHNSGKRNLNFQQIQSVTQSKQTKLSLQPVCPVTSSGTHHLLQLHHVQSVTPDASHQGIPIQQIKTVSTSVSNKLMSAQKFQPVAPKLRPEETATNISSTQGLSLQMKSVAQVGSNLKLPLPVINKRIPNPTSHQVVHKKKCLTRSKAVCCTKPKRKILPRPILPTANDSTPLHQASTLVPTKIMTQEIMKSAAIEKSVTVFVPHVGSATSNMIQECIPVPQATTIDSPKKLSPSQQEHAAFSYDNCLSLPEQQKLLVKSSVENAAPCHLLKSDGSSDKLLTSCDVKGEIIGDSHIALSFETNGKANFDFLESLEQNQEVYRKINSNALPTKVSSDLVNTCPNLVGSARSQTTHVYGLTFKDLCDDSSMGTEEITGLQESSYSSLESVDTSAHEQEKVAASTKTLDMIQEGWKDPNLEDNSIRLYELQYSNNESIKEAIITSHDSDPVAESNFLPEKASDLSQQSDIIYHQEDSLRISKNEEIAKETQLPNVSDIAGVSAVNDSLKQVSYMMVNDSVPGTQLLQYSEDSSTKDAKIMDEPQGNINDSSANEFLIQYQPVATSCISSEQSHINEVHDNSIIDQKPQVQDAASNSLFQEPSSNTISEGKQSAVLVAELSQRSDGVCQRNVSAGEDQTGSQQLNKEQVEPLEKHHQTEQEGRTQAWAAKGQRGLKRKWNKLSNGHFSQGLVPDYYKKNFRSFHTFQLQKRRVLEMSCLKQKIVSQGIRIKCLEQELQEERKKNELLRKKLRKTVSSRKTEVKRADHSLAGAKCQPQVQESGKGGTLKKAEESKTALEEERDSGQKGEGSLSSASQEGLAKMIHDFMVQEDVSQPCREGAGTSEKGFLRARLHFLQVLHKRFLADCCRACSFETFAKNIPENVVKLKPDEISVCVCMTCQNPELKIESLIKRRLLTIDTDVEEIISNDEAWDTFMATVGVLRARQAQLTYNSWFVNACDSVHKEKRAVTSSLAEMIDLLESELHALKVHLNRTCQTYEEVFKAKCEANASPHHAVLQCGWAPMILFHPVGTGGPAEPQGVVNMQCGYLWSKEETTGFAAMSDARDRTAAAVCASLEKVLEKMIKQGIRTITFITDPVTHTSCVREYTRRCEIQTEWIFLDPGHGRSNAETVGHSVTKLMCDSISSSPVGGLRSARDMFDLVSVRSSSVMHLYGEGDVRRLGELLGADANVLHEDTQEK
ncbi:uncharacterized protein LOC125042698 [Penaeus chinensis]|uniref:uncharacterized protein LOC125042698 n=1 Tax=Penaeus chinensis TaxID=139456 RepID=UPI001FB5BE52|nr:uncharacterized protein LOC125042698 [Penaeus chinensis]